jgi:hypothetical protein
MAEPTVEIIDVIDDREQGDIAKTISNSPVYVVYDVQTLEVVNMVTMKADDDDGESALGITFTPVAGPGQDSFVAENMYTSSMFGIDNYCDPSTKTVYMKPTFKLTLSEPNPVAGATVDISVDLVDYKGESLEGKWKGTLKVKDRLKFCSVSTKLMEWPENKVFRVRASSPGQSAVRVKDTEYKFVPGVEVITFSPEPF